MINIIAAVARNGIIGGDNSLLWHISEDLKRFKALTTGHPVIMGRKTWESLGRPLPGRTNVVISRNREFSAAGCLTAGSLGEALKLFAPDTELFIIGGGQIYAAAMPLADKIYLTLVDADYEGDTFFPAIPTGEWTEVSREHHERGEKYAHPFTFIDYVRR